MNTRTTDNTETPEGGRIFYHLRLLVADILKKFEGKTFLLFGFMIVGTGMEGFGMLMLLPLLSLMGIGETSEGTAGQMVSRIFEVMDFQPTSGHLLTLILIIFFIQYSALALQGYWSSWLNQKYVEIWRADLISAYLNAGWSFFSKTPSSRLSNNLITETNRIGGAFTTLNEFITAILVTCIYFFLALAISWKVTLSFLAGMVILFFLTWKILRSSYRIGADISAANEEFHFAANEYIGNSKYIKSSASEGFAISEFKRIAGRLMDLMFRGIFYPRLLKAVIEFATLCIMVVLLVLGVEKFQVPVAEVLVMAALLVRLYPRFSALQQNFQYLNLYLPSIGVLTQSLESALKEKESLDTSPLPEAIKSEKLKIDIQDLTVTYDTTPVLNKLSLTIEPGNTVGIVGSSGAGKSTLVDCLLGLVKSNEGSIRINGFELSELPSNTWRKIVGYVGQETFLFHSSIFSNISWGSSEKTREEVEDAARKAHAHQFIMKASEGYNTIIGDRGVRLSGGERQRIRLAQALLQQPRLLILDEATSALDSESEKSVMEAIQDLQGQITMVIVAHRLATVRDADRIFVLEKGVIVESGEFNELVSQKGRFFKLWQLQQNQMD